jgi:ABC transport system ATP-binding/permease protein
MNLISIEQIAKTLNDDPLFSGVSLGVDEGARIGLIGKNGTGKSTFLRILTGELEPDEGTIARNNLLRVSILEQVPTAPPETTLREYLYLGSGVCLEILRAYHTAMAEYEHHDAHARRVAELTEQMDQEQCWSIEHEYLSRLSELGIEELDRPMGELSGGMLKKAALARALSTHPNLLILDEPTNHLDISTIEWLENYLANSTMGFIMVTHDRYFLDAVCSSIFELDDQRIYVYEGNYSTFLERREQRMLEQQRYQDKLANILRTEREWLLRGPKARTTKNKGRIQRAYDLMDQQVQSQQAQAQFSSSDRRLGNKVLELKGITKSYGDTMVVSPFSYSFKRGERIGIVGPNGSGKTTFLDMISGRIPATGGSMELGVNTVFGYYDQMSRPLKDEMTVLAFMEEIAELVTLDDGVRIPAARFLERFGFPTRMHRVEIGRLSGGEKRRLYLVSILIRHPNFLILDEPTNDLDLDTMRRLEEYVQTFSGALLVVSHDRAFLDRTTDYLFVFDGSGSILGVSGSYSDYRAYIDQVQEEQKAASVQEKRARPVKRDKKGLTFKEKQEYEGLLEEIDALEEQKASLEELFCDPLLDPDRLHRAQKQYRELERLIPEKLDRWEYLADLDENG